MREKERGTERERDREEDWKRLREKERGTERDRKIARER